MRRWPYSTLASSSLIADAAMWLVWRSSAGGRMGDQLITLAGFHHREAELHVVQLGSDGRAITRLMSAMRMRLVPHWRPTKTAASHN